MSDTRSMALLGSAGALAAALLWKTLQSPKQRLPYPPGPKAYPIIGNLLDIPTKYSWRTYNQLVHIYGASVQALIQISKLTSCSGDVIHAEAFGQHIVVLNSAEAIQDLLERRSANYSSRPVMPMISDLQVNPCNTSLIAY